MLRDSKLLVVLAVGVGLSIPLTYVQWFSAHEHISYILRTVEWASELRRGVLYPRWCPDFYGGYGSPLLMFLGPVPYAFAGFLTATVMDPFSSLKAFSIVASAIAGVGTYALIFNETRNRDGALLGAMAYLAAPYRIGNLFERGDIAEFACIGFLPAVIALYRAAALEARPVRSRWLAAGAAVFHAIVIMTHPILGLWGTMLIGVIVTATAIGLGRRGMWHRALMLVGALACAPGLAAVYVVPAMVYRSTAKTAAMLVGWYNPEHQWILLGTLFEDDMIGTAMPAKIYKIGPIIVAAVVALAIGLFRNARTARRATGWLALTAVFIWLTLPQASWFWAPGRVPLVVFTQYPWRLLGPAVLTASVALGIGMAAGLERLAGPIRNPIVISGCALLLLSLALPLMAVKEMRTLGFPLDPDSIRRSFYSATDANEYLPVSVPAAPPAPRDEVVLRSDGATVELAHSDGSHHGLALRAQKRGATVILGLHGFPGWRIETVSGPAVARLDTDAAGLLRVHLPLTGPYHLTVWYGTPPAERVGMFLTALSVLVLCLLVLPASRFWHWRIPSFRVARKPA